MKKKLFISSLGLMLALSGVGAVSMPSVSGLGESSVGIVELDTTNDFLKTLASDGYVELGRYKVEHIKGNIYHWDEETKAMPGGATDEEGNMNNPSSMYFILSDTGVTLVDLGNGAMSEEDKAHAKTIIESMVGDKTLTILITHSHGDHVGWGKTPEVFENVTVDKMIVSEPDYEATVAAIPAFKEKAEKVNDGDKLVINGAELTFNVVGAHTPGSLMITDETNEALYIGDTFGSGFIWALWGFNDGNPLAALSDGVALARKILNANPNLKILAGHRWQQFWEENAQRPGEMSIQYFNDMNQVISGLLDGTTVVSPYDSVAWAPDAIELSSNGAKAKIDTLPQYVEAYKAAVNAMSEAYVYSASDKLSIESVNATAQPVFVVFPDGMMSDEEAQAYIAESGLKEVVDRSASKVYVARPANGEMFTEKDVATFETIVGKIGVANNFKLVGIGNGASFINQNLTSYMNFVSGLALINPEAGAEVNVSVPTYLVTDNKEVVDAYVKANNAKEVSDGSYANPESHYEIVVVSEDEDVDGAKATKDAWEAVLKKFGRIGNSSDVYKETATWYSRPLITGNKEVDSSRVYSYFDSVDAIDTIDRTVVTQDLDGDGIDSLWYEYVPESVKDAKEGTVPVVMLLHGNTNDPRTQFDTSGWAQVAEKEGIILICPEWQGHTYQGYTYDPMTEDDNQTANSDVIKMINIIKEKYPQIDASRIYSSGLSRGSRNTGNIILSNPGIFAAGAGHSGPFGTSDLNQAAVEANKEKYDMPVIFFTGDGDEYCKGAFDVKDINAGLLVAQDFQELNDMDITQAADIQDGDTYLYGVPWTTRYTIEPDGEGTQKIDVGMIENDKGVEIAMARIYGWGHWNYAQDAKLMWEFMSKYARDLETGASIRLDLQSPDSPEVEEPEVDVESPEVETPTEEKEVEKVQTGDATSLAGFVSLAALSALGILKAKKKDE